MDERKKTEMELLEKEVSEALTVGKFRRDDPAAAARRMLPPKYVATVRANRDPIADETRRFREMAEEADDRYDRY